jgi:hypothetical protein
MYKKICLIILLGLATTGLFAETWGEFNRRVRLLINRELEYKASQERIDMTTHTLEQLAFLSGTYQWLSTSLDKIIVAMGDLGWQEGWSYDRLSRWLRAKADEWYDMVWDEYFETDFDVVRMFIHNASIRQQLLEAGITTRAIR